MGLLFTHQIIDDEGEVIRQFRWNKKEASWYKNQNPHANVIALRVEKPKPFNFDDYEECLF